MGINKKYQFKKKMDQETANSIVSSGEVSSPKTERSLKKKGMANLMHK